MGSNLRHLLVEGVDRRHYSAAVLRISQRGSLLYDDACGSARPDSIFDLASLTKPLAAATVVMQLIKKNGIGLDWPIGRLIPKLHASNLASIRIDELLGHCSGLAAWRPYYETLRPNRGQVTRNQKARLRQLLARERLSYRPRTKTVYSDLGFMLLDWALEQEMSRPLDQLARDLVFQPLGLDTLRFVPLSGGKPSSTIANAVPTERCPWRKKRLRGIVHDDNCFIMGGVSGHAGLFGAAGDIDRLVTHLLRAYHRRNSIFQPGVVRQCFNASLVEKSSWALGWDRWMPLDPRTKINRARNFLGHMGYTGTSIWIDLQRQLTIVLLTNRVFYGREPNPMRSIRNKIHTAVLRHWSS